MANHLLLLMFLSKLNMLRRERGTTAETPTTTSLAGGSVRGEERKRGDSPKGGPGELVSNREGEGSPVEGAWAAVTEAQQLQVDEGLIVGVLQGVAGEVGTTCLDAMYHKQAARSLGLDGARPVASNCGGKTAVTTVRRRNRRQRRGKHV
jgi:hypothetical protein